MSYLLSYLFRMAFFFVLIVGSLVIVANIQNKNLDIHMKNGGVWTVVPSGLEVEATLSNSNEKLAGDTTIEFKIKDSLGNVRSSGTIKRSKHFNSTTDVEEIIRKNNIISPEIIADTTITAIGEVTWNSKSEVEIIEIPNDPFEMFPTDKVITEEFAKSQTIRIHAVSTKEKFIFIIMSIIKIVSAAILFLMLAQLFTNFSRGRYFQKDHIKKLKIIGWMLLLPQLSGLALYWIYLVNIHPIKIQKTTPQHDIMPQYEMLTQYSLTAGTEWSNIFLGLGIIILSYIFRDAIRLKEEHALTI